MWYTYFAKKTGILKENLGNFDLTHETMIHRYKKIKISGPNSQFLALNEWPWKLPNQKFIYSKIEKLDDDFHNILIFVILGERLSDFV